MYATAYTDPLCSDETQFAKLCHAWLCITVGTRLITVAQYDSARGSARGSTDSCILTFCKEPNVLNLHLPQSGSMSRYIDASAM